MGGQKPGRRRCDERGQCRPGARGRWGQRGASSAHQYAVDAGTAPGTPDAWTRTGSGCTVRTAVVASTTVRTPTVAAVRSTGPEPAPVTVPRRTTTVAARLAATAGRAPTSEDRRWR